MKRSLTVRALYIILAVLVSTPNLPIYGAAGSTEQRIDLDGNPLNGAESKVSTRVLSTFPVQVENTVFNNAGGRAWRFDWPGAGPAGFSSSLTVGPDVGARWIWTSTSVVYTIESPITFTPSLSVPVFGQHPGGVFPVEDSSPRTFIVPGKSIFPSQVTLSNASLTSSLITFFSPPTTRATCGVDCVSGQCDLFVENTSGVTATIKGEQPGCCLEPQQIICGGECYSYLEDTQNCGGCGIACGAGEICSNGECMCPEGQTQCGDGCFDLATDTANCGGCDTACVADQSCVEGSCLCPEGETVCGEACTSLTTDVANCGECGNACGGEQSCVAGACACPEGESQCSDECVALGVDEANCGACGTVCGEDQICVDGSCACQEGDLCGGACVDLGADEANCGACGTVCDEPLVCSEGECGCPGGLGLCGEGCFDLQTDPANCGACGTTCSEDETCSGGSCVCSGDLFSCGDGCVDLMADVANCGGCGNACVPGQTCVTGSCACGEGEGLCEGSCIDLQADETNCGACGTTCSEDETCTGGSCVCSGALSSCGESCVDLQSDAANCGACGTICGVGESCSAGACACPEGETLCGGQCVDLYDDPDNCGACGFECGEDLGCDNFTCFCPLEGQTDCSGTCTYTSNDDANCGACGNACGEDETCLDGNCCSGGEVSCGEGCVDLSADEANCGACGNVCGDPLVCSAGECGCPGGLGLCGYGCVDLLTDNANCGACGTTCSEDETCSGGSCVCSGATTSCGDECVDLQTDVANCGGCNQACGEDQACVGGSCACVEGDLCSGLCVDLQTDNNNCGTCGTVCESSECIDGVCDYGGYSGSAARPRSSETSRVTKAAPADGTASHQSAAPARGSAPVEKKRTASPVTPAPGTLDASHGAAAPMAATRAMGRGDGQTRTRTPGARPGGRKEGSAPDPDDGIGKALTDTPSPAAALPVEEAPVCDIAPFEQVVPNGGRFELSMTGGRYGKEIQTTVTLEGPDGEMIAQGPCPMIVPVLNANTTGVILSPVKIATVDSSGDAICQPSEGHCDYFLSLDNVGDTACLSPVATLASVPDEFNQNEVEFLNNTSAYPNWAAYPGAGSPPERRTNLTAFSIATPEEQGANQGRHFELTVDCANTEENIEIPMVLGIGGSCDPTTDLNGQTYDMIDGFRTPVNSPLILEGGPVDSTMPRIKRGNAIPLKIRFGCGGLFLDDAQIEPNPEIVSLVHQTLGPQPLSLINYDDSNPLHPLFRCDAPEVDSVLGIPVPQCQYNVRTKKLPLGNYVISVRMPDGRVFQAGFAIKP